MMVTFLKRITVHFNLPSQCKWKSLFLDNGPAVPVPSGRFDTRLCPALCHNQCHESCPVACCMSFPMSEEMLNERGFTVPLPSFKFENPPPPSPPPPPPPPVPIPSNPQPPPPPPLPPPPPPPPPPPVPKPTGGGDPYIKQGKPPFSGCFDQCPNTCAPACSVTCCKKNNVAQNNNAQQDGATIEDGVLSIKDMCPPICMSNCLPFCPDMCCKTSPTAVTKDINAVQHSHIIHSSQRSAVLASNAEKKLKTSFPHMKSILQQGLNRYSAINKGILKSASMDVLTRRSHTARTVCTAICMRNCAARCPLTCCSLKRKRNRIPHRTKKVEYF